MEKMQMNSRVVRGRMPLLAKAVLPTWKKILWFQENCRIAKFIASKGRFREAELQIGRTEGDLRYE